MEAEKEDQDENLVDETDQPHAPVDGVENALKLLMHNATDSRVWLRPHDLYNGVLNLPMKRSLHANVVNGFRCSKLETLVKMFPTKHEVSSSRFRSGGK